jgi:hypothetical protein
MMNEFVRMLIACACTRTEGLRLLAQVQEKELESKRFVCYTGLESMSRFRRGPYEGRMYESTCHKRAKYRDRKYLRNDFRGKISNGRR